MTRSRPLIAGWVILVIAYLLPDVGLGEHGAQPLLVGGHRSGLPLVNGLMDAVHPVGVLALLTWAILSSSIGSVLRRGIVLGVGLEQLLFFLDYLVPGRFFSYAVWLGIVGSALLVFSMKGRSAAAPINN